MARFFFSFVHRAVTSRVDCPRPRLSGLPARDWRHHGLLLPLGIIAALLFVEGCSRYQRPQRAAWRGQAERACLAQHRIRPTLFIQQARAIDGPSVCGLDYPFKVTALQNGAVAFNSPHTIDCPMIALLDEWLAEVVQPLAQATFGVPVAGLNGMGAYSCRGMNNQAGARISEHAFGNAMDIGGFRLADGRTISVQHDWTQGDAPTRAFLLGVQAGACSRFTTVLAPGSNIFHYNHIHLDLAMHGNTSTGPRRICKPAPPSMQAPTQKDNLPPAPDIEDEIDVAHHAVGESRTVALQQGAGSGLDVAVPPVAANSYASSARTLSQQSAPQPLHGSLREDGAFVPEGHPQDWDLPTSSIPQH
ncbi:extensin-like domain-containing protein [Beijerinckia mobilis]|uniref:extensin-like domain-containing protein n=1 Tax=Beijerinckia mobilis TaxID=231434 RepID=UPI000A019C4A|nr:extensin family protein [Beijerinckia mobilis]